MTSLTKNLFTLIAFFLLVNSSFVDASSRKIVVKRKQAKKALEAKYDPYSEKAISENKFINWGISPNFKKSSINLVEGWKKFEKKSEVVVAVVDTGIDPNHPYLRKNLFVKNGAISAANYGVDFSDKKKQTNTPIDTHGHGTHVAGIIKSVFPEVKILPIKYFNPKASGEDNLKSTIKALEYAVAQNVDIINYSGGGPKASPQEKKILEEAREKGILIIAAAGNEKSNIDIEDNAYYPASYGLANIITVSAHNEFNQIISSSNWGQHSVDIAAPGHKIRSSVPNFAAKLMTGTSQATAFVTGVAALVKSNYPKLSYSQIKNIIVSSSRKMQSLKGKVLGGGKLDAARALEVAGHVYNKLYSPKKAAPIARGVAKNK